MNRFAYRVYFDAAGASPRPTMVYGVRNTHMVRDGAHRLRRMIFYILRAFGARYTASSYHEKEKNATFFPCLAKTGRFAVYKYQKLCYTIL